MSESILDGLMDDFAGFGNDAAAAGENAVGLEFDLLDGELGLEDLGWPTELPGLDVNGGGESPWAGGGLLRSGEVAAGDAAAESPVVSVPVPKLPWAVPGGGSLVVHDFGDIGASRVDAKGNLIPPGYRAVHTYRGVQFTCKVVCVQPDFEYHVTNMSSGTTYSGPGVSMSKLFQCVRKEFEGSGKTVDGPLAFGLTHPEVRQVLCSMACVPCPGKRRRGGGKRSREVEVVEVAGSPAPAPARLTSTSRGVVSPRQPVVSPVVVRGGVVGVGVVPYVDFDDETAEAEEEAVEKAFRVLWSAEVGAGKKPSLIKLRFALCAQGLPQQSVVTMRALAGKMMCVSGDIEVV
jgi:hypothetical protein